MKKSCIEISIRFSISDILPILLSNEPLLKWSLRECTMKNVNWDKKLADLRGMFNLQVEKSVHLISLIIPIFTLKITFSNNLKYFEHYTSVFLLRFSCDVNHSLLNSRQKLKAVFLVPINSSEYYSLTVIMYLYICIFIVRLFVYIRFKLPTI